ncbi:hypothetical protein C8R45DRAFT_1108501 [Mycena sanguinolenta]|nr:hypothetical protein C8R45DRAFT_1108501 [Mycena sanguinolenta]
MQWREDGDVVDDEGGAEAAPSIEEPRQGLEGPAAAVNPVNRRKIQDEDVLIFTKSAIAAENDRALLRCLVAFALGDIYDNEHGRHDALHDIDRDQTHSSDRQWLWCFVDRCGEQEFGSLEREKRSYPRCSSTASPARPSARANCLPDGLNRYTELRLRQLHPDAPACSQCGAFVFSTGRYDFELDSTTAARARITDLSGTNEPPLDAELSVIRSILEQISARLATLDAEISRIKDYLRDLEEKRTALSKYHSQNTGILSPPRRMPPEILGEIFSWTTPSIRDVFSTEDCPWVLTHVCSTGRAVALSQPSLWSLIVIDFSIEERYPLKTVSTQVERARSLKIHFFGDENHDSRPQIALFGLLAEHSSRWEEFHVQLTLDLVPHVQTLDLTPLRKAWVQWATAESYPPEYDTIDFLQTATSPIDVSVCCEHGFLPTRLPVLHHLTRYDFDAPWETHAQLLKSFPNLQEARIYRHFDHNELRPKPGEPIDLLHLRRLFLNDPTTLNYLRAPGLREIAIHSSDAEDRNETRFSLERFLKRSSCFPHRLRIQGLVDASIAAILRRYPSFADIAVVSNDYEDEDEDEYTQCQILSLFTICESTPSKRVFPQITKIGFTCQDPDALLSPFLDMLESRWEVADCALKGATFVSLDPDADWDPEEVARIQTLRDAGLRVSLLSGDDANDCIDWWIFNA